MASLSENAKSKISSSPRVTPARSSSASAIGSSVTAPSSSLESRLLARFNEYYLEQHQALQQVASTQKKQHDAILEHHFAVLSELRACTRMQQPSISVEQLASIVSIRHLQEQEKRIIDYVQACFQRQENILAKLIISLDVMTQRQAIFRPIESEEVALNGGPGAVRRDLEKSTSKENGRDKDFQGLLATAKRSMTDESQEASNSVEMETSNDAFSYIDKMLSTYAPDDVPDNLSATRPLASLDLLDLGESSAAGSADLSTPLLRQASQMLVGRNLETKATIDKILQEAEEETEEEGSTIDGNFWSQLAHHMYYHDIAVAFVLLNVIWIGIETDVNQADILCHAPLYVQVVDNIFCVFFVVDIFIRSLAREPHSFHFWLDFLLVAEMAWETWIQVAVYLCFGSRAVDGSAMQILRVFRLVRVMRALRMHKAVTMAPQLMILIKGIVAAMKAVCAILSLMFICIYFFAVVFTKLAKTNDLGGSFDTVPQSLEFFLVQIVSGVDSDVIPKMLEAGLAYYILFLCFVFIGTMTLMNMLIGILCNVISTVCSEEKEKYEIAGVEKNVADLVATLDTGGTKGANSGSLSREEFEKLFEHPVTVKALASLEVDIVAFTDFVRFATPDDDEISLADLTQMVLQCRGNQICTVRDIIDIRKFVAMQHKLLREELRGGLKSLHV